MSYHVHTVLIPGGVPFPNGERPTVEVPCEGGHYIGDHDVPNPDYLHLRVISTDYEKRIAP